MLETRAFEPDFCASSTAWCWASSARAPYAPASARSAACRDSASSRKISRNTRPGDDLRFLDWNAFARLDELMLRTYRAERQVEVTSLIDASASMGLPERDDKLGLALALGASLAYIGMADNDAVRIGAFAMHRGSMRARSDAVPSPPRVVSQLQAVRRPRCARAARPGLAPPSMNCCLQRRPAGTVVVISDFLVNEGDLEDALKRLVAARHEVKVVHVMGEQESTAAYPPGLYRIRDAETGEVRETALGPTTVAAIRRKVEKIAARVREICTAHAITYAQAFGAGNLDSFMERELPLLGIVR